MTVFVGERNPFCGVLLSGERMRCEADSGRGRAAGRGWKGRSKYSSSLDSARLCRCGLGTFSIVNFDVAGGKKELKFGDLTFHSKNDAFRVNSSFLHFETGKLTQNATELSPYPFQQRRKRFSSKK